MKNHKSRFPLADVYARNSNDGVTTTGPVVKEVVVCLNGLGKSHNIEDLLVIQLSNNDAIKLALKLLENLNFEGKWL